MPVAPGRPHGPLLLFFAFAAAFLFPRGAGGAPLPPAQAQIAIPVGDAADTLRLFSRQSGEQILYSPEAVRGIRTPAVRGWFTPRDALARLLTGTGLAMIEDPATGALAVRLPPAAPSPPPPAGPADPSPPAEPPPPPASPDSPIPSEIISLPSFEAEGHPSGRYHPRDGVAALRISDPILDTPLSVAVVTRDFLEDVGAGDMFDATRYFSGVSNGRGAGMGGIEDRQNFRGFESFSRTVDGFSTFLIPGNQGFQWNVDPAFIESIEIVKGPDSILSPTGSPGGSVDVATKSPQFQQAGEVDAEERTPGLSKVTVDSTGPLGAADHWAYRVIADYEDGRTYVPGGLRQWNLSAQATWLPSANARLTLKYFGAESELYGATADPNDNGWYVTDPSSVNGATIARTPSAASGFSYDGWNGDTAWSQRSDQINILMAEFTGTLADSVSVRLTAMALADSYHLDAGYPASPGPAGIYDPASGREIGLGPFNPANLPEVATTVQTPNRDLEVQNDFATHLRFGSVTFQPVAGWTFQNGGTPGSLTANTPLPTANLLDGSAYAPAQPSAYAYATTSSNHAYAWQAQGYALTRTGFLDDRVFLTTGVSRLWTRTTTVNQLSDTALTLDGSEDTTLLGVLAKPLPDLSVYATTSSNAAIAAGPGNAPLWQTGDQTEAGVKVEALNGRLSLTAADFSIKESNIVSQNPLFNLAPATTPSTTVTDERNHGTEFELVADVTRSLSVVASLTEMQLRDAYGRRLRNVPDSLANLLADYRFTTGPLSGLSVTTGIQHSGTVAGETATGFTPLGVPEQPGFYLPDWTVLNAGLSYPWRRFRLSLNVDNLLDSRFPWEPAGRNSVSPYPGTALRTALQARF